MSDQLRQVHEAIFDIVIAMNQPQRDGAPVGFLIGNVLAMPTGIARK